MSNTLSTIRIVAAVVDTKKLTLYKEDGSTITIPQGDPQVREILEVATPLLMQQNYADISISSAGVENPYRQFEKTSGVVKFFKVAKSKLEKLFSKNVEPQVVGTIPTVGSAMELLKRMEEEINEVLDRSVTSNSPTFQEGVYQQKPIVEENGYTPGRDIEEDLSTDTLIAVVGGNLVPGVERIRSQFINANNMGNTKGLENFLRRAASVNKERSHSIEDLFKFMERGDLPVADDGSILIYKVLNKAGDDFVDCRTGRVIQKVGSYVCMDKSLVDMNRNNECSNGLHVARRGYIRSFSGDVCVLAKVAPEDVITVPSYDANKMRVCGYHIICQLTSEQYKLVRRNRPMSEDPDGKILLGKAIAGNHIDITNEVRITQQYGQGVVITEKKDSKGHTVDSHKENVPVEALVDEIEENRAPPVDPRKIAKQVHKMTRKEKVDMLYERFKNDPSSKVAQDLLDLKKTSKVSWSKLGLNDKIGQNLSEYLESVNQTKDSIPKRPQKPSKAKAANKVPTQPEKPESLKGRVWRLYTTMLTAQDSIMEYDAAREIYRIKRNSRKSWEYLGLHPSHVAEIKSVLTKNT